MLADLLLTGLVGGVLGAGLGSALVILSDRHRWHRENGAAVRLVFYEITSNLGWLENLTATKAGIAKLLTKDTWDQEQVRVALHLTSHDLAVVATAYLVLSPIVRFTHEFAEMPFTAWLASNDGKGAVSTAAAAFEQARDLLEPMMRAGLDARPAQSLISLSGYPIR